MIKLNKKDELALKLTETIMAMEYLAEQIDLINNYNISLVDDVIYKALILEDYIENSLNNIWKDAKLDNLDKKKFQKFLDRLNYNAIRFRLRLNQFREVITKNLGENRKSCDLLKDWQESLELKFNLEPLN